MRSPILHTLLLAVARREPAATARIAPKFTDDLSAMQAREFNRSRTRDRPAGNRIGPQVGGERILT